MNKPVILSVFKTAILLFSLLANSSIAAPAKPPADVIVSEVKLQSYAQSLELLGTLKALQSIELKANSSEILQKIFIKDGQTVSRNQLLFELSDQQELALLKQARINAAEKKRQYLRAQKLRGQGNITEAVIDERQAEWQSAEAEISIIQAQIDDRQIRAPFSGQIGLLNVSLGDLITPGTVLTTLDDTSELLLDLQIPSQYLESLFIDQQIKVYRAAPATLGRIYEADQEPILAKIIAISPRIDPQTLLLPVRAKISKPKKLKSGMIVKSQLQLNPLPSLMISNSAILMVGERKFVYRLNGVSADTFQASSDQIYSVEKIEVKLGQRLTGQTQIIEGLKAGDIVVSQGALRLSPKSQVLVKAVEKAGAPVSLKPKDQP